MIFVYRSVNPLLKKDEDRFFDPSSLILIDNNLLFREGVTSSHKHKPSSSIVRLETGYQMTLGANQHSRIRF
jgi:hypothetical protein